MVDFHHFTRWLAEGTAISSTDAFLFKVVMALNAKINKEFAKGYSVFDGRGWARSPKYWGREVNR